MKRYKIIILGSGYSGANAYYELKNKQNVLLIDSKKKAAYHGKSGDISMKIPVSINETVKKVDFEKPGVLTDKHEYFPDKLIIATGCDRGNQIKFMNNKNLYRNKTIGSASEYDDYILLQYILRLNKEGIRVGYSGNFLSFLGAGVESGVREFLRRSGILFNPEPDFIFPACKPNLFDKFISVDKNLMVNENVYAVGDAINWPIKLGELSMRQGVFAGERINGKSGNFKPVFITILDNLRGLGIRIKSTDPWVPDNGSAHIGRQYSIMSRFLMRYYVFGKGRMGILKYF
jgi:NADH dehydrogenase FAD-containing subunit